MKPPFGSHAQIGGYVPSWKAQIRRKDLRLPELVLALARTFESWFTIDGLGDVATGALAVEHYRDKYAQRRVIAVQLVKLYRDGTLDRRTGPGRRVHYRVRRRRCGGCASCLGAQTTACAAWSM